MPKLYQYLIKNIPDIQNWLNANGFNSVSFKKVIVEAVEEVRPFNSLPEALKESLIIKIRFFDKDCDFSAVKDKDEGFNIIILTEKEIAYENQAYEIIESRDIENYNRFDKSEFKIKKYICEPILTNKSNDSDILSVPELLVFYRIYG